ncbi:response regulator transcription factor [Aestuariivirga sp.]|uniref:response regulator transcription factor n=1 Tax=Aestuariivirga sp. TaxID=2650926 RepID=UPI003BABAAAA
MPSQPQAPLIAIVDDDPGVRGSVDSLLRSAGLAGRSFPCAEALLCCGEESRIACIITDLHMPGMSGIELQAELARRGWRQPLIVMTAFPSAAAREQALASGALAFLTKPIDPDALLAAVERAIG